MSPEVVILLVLAGALVLYAVLGGADFGAGIWEFNTALQSTARERDLVYRAIGPVWEANHVWLIFVLVMLHTAFPLAFAALFRALWLPCSLALVGIVFRGAAYAFRSHRTGAPGRMQLWMQCSRWPRPRHRCAWARVSERWHQVSSRWGRTEAMAAAT